METKNYIIAIISAIGGLEAIKWTVQIWMNRKTEKRKQAAEAAAVEIENYHKQVDFLHKQLKDCYIQMEQLHKKLHESRTELENWIIRFTTLETALEKAERWSCNKSNCPERQRNEFKKNNYEKN